MDREEIEELLLHEVPERRIEGALACYDRADASLFPVVDKALVEEENTRARATLIKALAAVGGDRAIPRILEYLRDPDARVRANSVEALSRFEDRELDLHFERMISDPHSRVAGNAIIALADRDRVKFRDALQEISRSTTPSACLTALYVLSKFEEPWTVDLLGQMAVRKDNPVTAQTMKVLEQLAQWNVPGAASALASAKRGDVVETSCESLLVLRPPKVTERNLEELLSAPSARVRIFAIQESAQRLDLDFVLPLLVSRIKEEENPHVLATLTKWIGMTSGDEYLDLLEPYLQHEDLRVRANTLEGLLGKRNKRVKEIAKRCSNDESPRVRALAARILSHFDGEEAFGILKEMVLSQDSADAESVLHCIDKLDEHLVVEILQLALLRGGRKVSNRVLSVLSSIEEKFPLARRLRQKLESGSFAAQEGGYIRQQIARLDSPDDALRLAALEQLRFSRSTQAWDAIEDLARQDKSQLVQNRAKQLALQCRIERERRVHFYSFGLRVQQLYERGLLKVKLLFRLCEQVALLDQALDDDEESSLEPIERLVMERTNSLVLLGERAWSIYRDGGALEDETLEDIARELEALEDQ